MIEYEMPNEGQLERLRDLYNKNSWVKELTSNRDQKEMTKFISLTRLYTYLTSFTKIDEELEEQVRNNVNLLRIYKEIVDQTAIYRLPEAMAASSNQLPFVRHGTGWKLRIELSRAEPNQVYIIIELDGGAVEFPKSIFVFEDNRVPIREELPEFNEGVTQFISDRHSDLVNLLMNPKTVAYLR